MLTEFDAATNVNPKRTSPWSASRQRKPWLSGTQVPFRFTLPNCA